MTREEYEAVSYRLQTFIREPSKFTCHAFSKGAGCECPLCDLDRLYEAANPDDSSSWVKLGRQVGELVAEKNAAYGDSFGTSAKALALLYPNGIPPEKYGDALALVRIWDKMQRIATKKDAFGESPYRDIAGYGLLGLASHSNDKKEDNNASSSGQVFPS